MRTENRVPLMRRRPKVYVVFEYNRFLEESKCDKIFLSPEDAEKYVEYNSPFGIHGVYDYRIEEHEVE